MQIGSLIKGIRKRNGWSQTQMADALGVVKSTISLYEHNRRSPRDVKYFTPLFGLANDREKAILREWAKNR